MTGVPTPDLGGWTPFPPATYWNQHALANSFNTMTLTPSSSGEWYMDSGAHAHMMSSSGNLSSSSPPSLNCPPNIIVGNGSLLPVISTGHTSFSTERPLCLHSVLVSPHIIKNLISVRQFTIDNSCSIEFDPFGLSVKDMATRNEIVRCNSSGRLYSFHVPPCALLAATTPSILWHRHLGYLGVEALSHLVPCNKRELEPLCHACQLGRHV